MVKMNEMEISNNYILKFFSKIINLMVYTLLVGVIIVALVELFRLISIFFSGTISGAISIILYIIILIELFVILTDFIRNKHISLSKVVEIGIISLVRDVIFKFDELGPDMLFGIAAVILSLGLVFWVGRKYKTVFSVLPKELRKN